MRCGALASRLMGSEKVLHASRIRKAGLTLAIQSVRARRVELGQARQAADLLAKRAANELAVLELELELL